MAKYLSLGNVLYDSTIAVDGTFYGEYLGGQGFHAMVGIRLWPTDVGMVTRAGMNTWSVKFSAYPVEWMLT